MNVSSRPWYTTVFPGIEMTAVGHDAGEVFPLFGGLHVADNLSHPAAFLLVFFVFREDLGGGLLGRILLGWDQGQCGCTSIIWRACVGAGPVGLLLGSGIDIRRRISGCWCLDELGLWGVWGSGDAPICPVFGTGTGWVAGLGCGWIALADRSCVLV